METEKQNPCENQIESSVELCTKKKKICNFLLKIAVSAVLIALFVLFVYLLGYTFKYDGADLLRKIA